MKIDKHGLNITGLKKCSGDTRNYSERSACYNEIFYDKADGEVWADFHCSIGGNEWTEYRSKNVIRICSTAEHLTMQEIADMIRDKLDEIDHMGDCAAW
jgi:phage gp46-like protein